VVFSEFSVVKYIVLSGTNSSTHDRKISTQLKMYPTRRQLTLFIGEHNETIERIRTQFNPIQFNLVAAHVTLCREDEIEQIEKVIENIKSLAQVEPLRIEFDPPERFENGKGVFIPAKKSNHGFSELRKTILNGLAEHPREHLPHITLLHPRNSTCTDIIWEHIQKQELPTELFFDKISLIEQHNGGPWTVIAQFSLVFK
jgi:2'-5' RNA ligase